MTKRKKIFILVTMVVVLGVAAYLNIMLLNNAGQNNTISTSYFVTHKAERQTQRMAEFAALDEIIALTGDEYAEARQNALSQKMKYVDIMETELLLEGQLKGKGFDDVVVSVGLNSDIITVMVKKSELTRDDTAKIYNVINTHTAKTQGMIKINPMA